MGLFTRVPETPRASGIWIPVEDIEAQEEESLMLLNI
jgi:hypothetical protein